MMHRDDLTGSGVDTPNFEQKRGNLSDLANREGYQTEVDAIEIDRGSIMDNLDLNEEQMDVGGILSAIKDDYDEEQNSEWRMVMNAALAKREREAKTGKRRGDMRWRGGRGIVKMVGAVASGLVVFMLITSTAAYAFNWQGFLELFAPFSEVFSFFASRTEPDETSTPDNEADATDGITFGDDESALTTAYMDYDEFVASNPEARSWLSALPEGYVFESGERSDSPYWAVLFGVFRHEDNTVFVKKYMESDEYASAWLFELVADKMEYVNINGFNVTIYRNMTELNTGGASWQDGKTIMNIWTDSNVPEGMIEQIVHELTRGNTA